jgi:hypothetical protein
MHGIESKCRNRPVEESLAIFKEMQEGTERGLTHCMRFKMNMQDPNKTMRDPVGYRCNLTHHWRTGTKYKVRLGEVEGSTGKGVARKEKSGEVLGPVRGGGYLTRCLQCVSWALCSGVTPISISSLVHGSRARSGRTRWCRART